PRRPAQAARGRGPPRRGAMPGRGSERERAAQLHSDAAAHDGALEVSALLEAERGGSRDVVAEAVRPVPLDVQAILVGGITQAGVTDELGVAAAPLIVRGGAHVDR